MTDCVNSVRAFRLMAVIKSYNLPYHTILYHTCSRIPNANCLISRCCCKSGVRSRVPHNLIDRRRVPFQIDLFHLPRGRLGACGESLCMIPFYLTTLLRRLLLFDLMNMMQGAIHLYSKPRCVPVDDDYHDNNEEDELQQQTLPR